MNRYRLFIRLLFLLFFSAPVSLAVLHGCGDDDGGGGGPGSDNPSLDDDDSTTDDDDLTGDIDSQFGNPFGGAPSISDDDDIMDSDDDIIGDDDDGSNQQSKPGSDSFSALRSNHGIRPGELQYLESESYTLLFGPVKLTKPTTQESDEFQFRPDW